MQPKGAYLKAITLYQPWAQLIALGAKTMETRGWKTEYRGTIAIHAGKNTDWIPDLCRKRACKDAVLDATWNLGEAESYRHHFAPQHDKPTHRDFPIGAIVATCELVDCIQVSATPRRFRLQNGRLNVLVPPDAPESTFGDFRIGRYAWILQNPRLLAEPVPCRGFQQLWDVPADIAAQILEQLK